MDLSLLPEGAPIILLSAVLLLGAFTMAYRETLTGVTDPLFLNGCLVCLYVAGLFGFLSHQDNLPPTSLWITAGIVAALFVPSLLAPAKIRRGTQATPDRVVVVFVGFILFLLLLNLVSNYAFGVVPLFAGTESRSEQGGVPLPTLVLVAPSLGIAAISILALSHNKNIRLLGALCTLLWVLTIILSGAKSAILQLLIVLFFYNYLKKYRGCRQITQDSKRDWKKILLIATGAIAAPAYFAFVVTSDGAAGLIGLFLYRLFTGFDIVVYMTTNEISTSSSGNIHIWDFYLYPFLKFFGLTPQYQSAGQYVSAEVFGYSESLQTLNPNSNLVVEWILSFGILFGILGSLLLVTFAFRHRRKLLSTKNISVLDMFLMPQFVLAPFGLLLDGSLFVLTVIWTLLIYAFINTFVNIFATPNIYRFKYVFY